MSKSSQRHAGLFILALTVPFLAYNPALANGGGAKEIAKYLVPEKKGYRNESQDREIKKKSFKIEQTPVAGAAVNKEVGFFAIVPADKLSDETFATSLLQNPRVNGLSATVPWSALQPTEDNYDWHQVDNLLSLCEKNGKTLILRVSTCGVDLPSSAGSPQTIADTPKWVFDSGIKSITFSSPDGKQHVMPIFWDKDYLAKWNNFVRELASKYDKNPNIHSIGITGGGFNGGTSVLPDYTAQVVPTAEGQQAIELSQALKSQYGMDDRQLVEHWKYVADQFPKRFQTARLIFNINPPVPKRHGEDALDQISDYLVYRYGDRIYLSRKGIHDGHHGFDDYRLLLKFHNDTLTGLQLTDNVAVEDMAKITKHALDDGVTFAELPASLVTSSDANVASALDSFKDHIGYQIIGQKATVSDKIAVGQPLKAAFSFVNVGAAPAIRPERNFDKDSAASFRMLVELRDAEGKPVLQNLHTPPTPTSAWKPGQPITWEEELKMVDADKHQLPPGEYSAWISLIDPVAKRKIHFVNATLPDKVASAETVEVGKVVIVSTDQMPKGQPSSQSRVQDQHE